jgi:myo-inositol 2-dehydrogenase/D-chiro-inositol 1-dehydrogenase
MHHRGGILLDQGIHMLNVCNWVIQKLPHRAIGSGGIKESSDFVTHGIIAQVLYQYPQTSMCRFILHSLDLLSAMFAQDLSVPKGWPKRIMAGEYFIQGENKWDSGILREAKEFTAEQRAAGSFTSSLHDANDNKVRSFINSI